MDSGVMYAFMTLIGFVLLGVGLVLGSLIAAIWLRLAATWLRLGNIPYVSAFKAALLSSFVVLAVNLSINLNYWMIFASQGERVFDDPMWTTNFLLRLGPSYYLYVTVLNLLVIAALFRTILPAKEGDSRMLFGDCFALASLYYAISVAVALAIGLVAYSLAGAVLAVTG
jgi:hypothetical protein